MELKLDISFAFYLMLITIFIAISTAETVHKRKSRKKIRNKTVHKETQHQKSGFLIVFIDLETSITNDTNVIIN